MLSCPIFHVQGESPESALHAVDLAMEYRSTYRRDVVIELICYRRHGHNEGDEPAFTQPMMYKQISARPSVNHIYSAILAEDGSAPPEALEQIERHVSEALEASFDRPPIDEIAGFSDRWSGISSEYSSDAVNTAVATEKLVTLARRLAALPSDFTPHAKIGALIQKRFEAVLHGVGIDWGNAETLAYATLLDQGYAVRLSGQDSQRGTFNHRHCVVFDSHSERSHTPLETIAREEGGFHVWNSPLSEFGVLGFEYGYSVETPHCLTLWEAQFGDFSNGAQVVIDQFIASGETKWNRASGLVLLLPHGYEGQGAEHSSARIERYLQLCAADNMLVVCPSTPAQMFHLLRRQLRHPKCSSTIAELSSAIFQTCIVPPGDYSAAKKVLFCSGKIYYELEEERIRCEQHDTVIVRIEQLYPLDLHDIQRIVKLFTSDCRRYWVQEEPENMGAWHYIERHFRDLSCAVGYIGRPADSCPAVSSHHVFAEQQKEILNKAFN
jgi:2-oxoglutarate dehydrogenase E1 component